MSHRACFVALHASPAIDPSVGRPVGGTETRAWIFATGLGRQPDWKVSFVIRREAGSTLEEHSGVQVLRRPDRLYSLYESVGRCVQKVPQFPFLRMRRWDPRLLWQLPLLAICRPFERRHRDPRQPDQFFRTVETDVFVTFGVQANSARVVATGKALQRPVVLMIGSDGDLDERYVPGSTHVSPYGDRAEICHWQITQADAIVVQTEQQQRMLKERFDRDATIIPNPLDVAWWAERCREPSAEVTGGLDRYVLWVGRAEAIHKRPQLLIELAQSCPGIPFVMILNPRDPALEEQIRRDVPDNVRIVPSVRYDEMPAVMSRAALLVSTSALEGFPNVFLQAAACRVPIASLRVGREFLEASRGGVWADDELAQLQAAITELWADRSRCEQLGTSGSEYVAQFHDAQTQVGRLAELLQSIVAAE